MKKNQLKYGDKIVFSDGKFGTVHDSNLTIGLLIAVDGESFTNESGTWQIYRYYFIKDDIDVEMR
jgi:hypothetical protein